MLRYNYNPESLTYEVKKKPKYLKYLRLALFAGSAAGMVVLYFWLYISVLGWDLPKTALLKRRHAEWEARMDVLDNRLGNYERTLTGIEQRDDDVYRTIYGMHPIPDEVKYSGLGGANRYADLERLGANSALKRAVLRIDMLTKRAYVSSKALDEVSVISRQAGDMLSCIPGVPPILPDRDEFRLSSSFGYRIDPVYGGGERHQGQDFAARTGTPVYATGDAVVVKTNFQFRGYGNEIVLDHGYGYKTRYAHLSVIDVAEGMKVSRGDRIGAVGNTGKSTGPHLHYEVLHMDRRVNPMNFMDINMPTEEYRAMVEKHRDDSSFGKRSSTLELLKRGRGGNER